MTTLPPTYAPRPLRTLASWQVGALAVKVYHIGAAAPSEDLLQAARNEAARMDQAAMTEADAHGLGFVVIHEGEAGTWLLMDWWAHGDILCQRLSLARGAEFEAMDDRPLAACVWELAVIGHERDAWLRHMMTGGPDPEGYLSDRLAAEAV
ncbi:hypothetical protein OCH239_11180 [Roseivivax halodurans JCM 10272]|uniref:Uncharacterized protein n=1 Tax=Roseivivax halodurans JCM 10272 TaxID=1449350 RepID=X7EI03_9RHOB|nr:hypothetical protein [Roseivivax halodurans]ETX15739.1 hypothetical protein OCH239_11180 [Roseivivax halodurans JCM 10272]